MAKETRPIVIVKKVKKGGHGHHGGSWKVAYADFVTAMMAFFMVMWLVGLDDETRRHIEQYFSHSVGFFSGSSTGDSPINNGPAPASAGDVRFQLIVRRGERQAFEEAAARIRSRLDSLAGGLSNLAVEIVVTEDGLRIELLESGGGETYFPRGSAELQPTARTAVAMVGAELAGLRNSIILEGHTDAVPYAPAAAYTNWELSGDRANTARRLLEQAGVAPMRVREVRAMGPSRLRNPDDPLAAENRRIAIILPFSELAQPASRDSARAASQPSRGD